MNLLAFTLKVPGTDEFEGLSAVSVSYRISGLLELRPEVLVIQWSGEVLVEEVGLAIREDREVLPAETIHVPLTELYRASLDGGWFRPRLTLEARDLRAFDGIPSGAHGKLPCRYARKDRFEAIAMAAAINSAITAARSIEAGDTPHLLDTPVTTPPEGITPVA